MENIKNYIISILYISAFAILLELFIPKNKIKKYISAMMSMLVILTIASPLLNVFKGDNLEDAIDNAIYAISSNQYELSRKR
ncbi:MAG: stage III sporulation protein AF [Clostridia bacterium]|nr:stage III sporulation protein AF [Clostridia bacterium]